ISDELRRTIDQALDEALKAEADRFHSEELVVTPAFQGVKKEDSWRLFSDEPELRFEGPDTMTGMRRAYATMLRGFGAGTPLTAESIEQIHNDGPVPVYREGVDPLVARERVDKILADHGQAMARAHTGAEKRMVIADTMLRLEGAEVFP